MHLPLVRPLLEQQIDLFLRLLQVVTGDQQVGQVETRLPIVGIQVRGARELLVGWRPLLHLQVTLSQLIVGLGVRGIDARGIQELHRSFGVLALLKVLLTTPKIFELAHIGVTRTSRKVRSLPVHNKECRRVEADLGHVFPSVRGTVAEPTGPKVPGGMARTVSS